jgi:tetratricopeptide (TPR) repeat protein
MIKEIFLKRNIFIVFLIIGINFYFLFGLNFSNNQNLTDIIDKYIRFDNWKEAKASIEDYLKSNPTDTYAYSLYANVLAELKLYDDAIVAARTALNYEKNSETQGEFYNQLGFFYYSKNLNDLAIEMYSKSVSLNNSLDSSYYMLGLLYSGKNDYDNTLSNWKRYIMITTNQEKKKKMQQIVSMLEKKFADDKMKKEEEAKLKADSLKKLQDELDKDNADSKSLEADKNKTKKSNVELEEIE